MTKEKKRKRQLEKDEFNESFIINELKLRLSTLEGDVFDLQEKNNKLENKVKSQDEENERLKLEINRERARVDGALKSINKLEQYQRTNNIRVFGLEDREQNESQRQTESKITTLLRNKLGITVEPRDIEACHRLGRFSTSADRPVIVRFTNRKIKVAAISNRRKLKGHKVVITEDLTQSNYQKLKQVKELDHVK